jgi:hypothetical protein
MKTLVAVGGMLAVLLIPLYLLQVSGLQVGSGVQPRYILPLLPVVSLVLLTGRRPDQAVRLSRVGAWLTWVLLSVANSVALMVNIRRYTTGFDGPMLPGREVEWWSTNLIGPLPTWFLGSLGFAVAAWMIVRLSSGRDSATALAASSDQKALAPGPHSKGESAPQVVAAPPVPIQPVPVSPAPVEPPSAPTIAAGPATQEYKASGPAIQGPPSS